VKEWPELNRGGDSDGADAALLITSYEPHLVDAIVANSPGHLIVGADGAQAGSAAWTFHGKPLTPRDAHPGR
jgi:hypothetical protein